MPDDIFKIMLELFLATLIGMIELQPLALGIMVIIMILTFRKRNQQE